MRGEEYLCRTLHANLESDRQGVNSMQSKLVIDTRMEAYGTFFNDDFAHRAFASAKHIALLERPVFDLIASWRCSSYAAALPSLLVSGLRSFGEAFANKPGSAGMLTYSEAVLAKLCQEIPLLCADTKLCREIQSRIVNISAQIIEADNSVHLEIEEQTLWQQHLELYPFIMGIHASMQQAYLAILSAYEDFLISLIKTLLGPESVRGGTGAFKSQLRQAFGDLAQELWHNSRLHAARLVRHALLHAGGKITKDLEAVKIPVVVQHGRLHVFPENNKALFKTLKESVLIAISDESVRAKLTLATSK